jgi:hypothetical protein
MNAFEAGSRNFDAALSAMRTCPLLQYNVFPDLHGSDHGGVQSMLHQIVFVATLVALPGLADAQSVTQLASPAPDGAVVTFQLTDGTVLAQGNNLSDWWILTPDNKGNYANGNWKQVASLPPGYAPYAMSSQVLGDGRVLIDGGEYNPGYNDFTLTNLGAIYDPVADSWANLKPPAGWANIGDSPSVVLPDGDFVIGNKLDERMASLNPKTMVWTALAHTGKHDFNAEEGWTLLPADIFMTIDVKANPRAERYSPKYHEWITLPNTPVNLQGPPCCGCTRYPPKNLCYYPPGEIGPALLMPNGTVFATGATHSGQTAAHSAIYTPGTGWKAGPDFPNNDQAGDDFASLLPNGHALVEGNSGTLYEFDGTTLRAEPVNASGSCLMILPSGGVLIGGFEIYTSQGNFNMAWRPTITGSPSTVARGSTYKISGTQFNGLSQANAFGDELQTSTNYPLVRITNNATRHVFFARTHDHSTMGVATGAATVSTNFDVPPAMETGAGSFVVVANGIPSDPVAVTVQ